jgi:prepilin-type N-terminal cleavage/methylation domain-containing protein
MEGPISSLKHRRGFTLIELLVVVVIISVLLAIAIPSYLSQQVKAKDTKAKHYLSYAYRNIRSGIPETNNKFPANISMVSWVQQSEPALNASVGNCYALGSLATNAVVVDSGSSSGNLTLCTRSDSGNIWKLAATPTSEPNFLDATVVPLAISGNEITDSVRLAGVQGDGRAPPTSSTGIWEGATNLAPNGGFETNTVGWANRNSGVTISRVTSDRVFGSACLQIVSNGSLSDQGAVTQQASPIAVTANSAYTISFWARYTTLSSGDAQLNITPQPVATAQRTITLTNSWQQYTYTFTNDSNTTMFVIISSVTSSSMTWLLDGFQIEKKPVSSPYVETNGASATRGAARVQIPAALLSPTQGWVAMRVRMGWASSTLPSTFPVFFTWRSGDSSDIIQMVYAGGNIQTERRAAGVLTGVPAKATTWAVGDVMTVISWWTATQSGVSVNGSAATVAANTGNPTTLQSLFDIGSVGGGNSFIDSDVLWLSSGTGIITNTDAAAINGFGNNDPNVSAFSTTTQADFVWNGDTSNGSLK